MVGVSDHLFPTSKADIWSLWVGRCFHTLVTCIAEPKSDPRRDRYLAKFGLMEDGISEGNEIGGFPLGWNLVLFELHILQLF